MSEPSWLRIARSEGRIVSETVQSALVLKDPKPSKYKNRKVECDGHLFDSNKESERYIVLNNWQKFGVIRNLRLQVRLPIVVNGVKVCSYVADFVFEEVLPDGEWREVIEDVKSEFTRRNPLYRLKKKLLLAACGRHIREV